MGWSGEYGWKSAGEAVAGTLRDYGIVPLAGPVKSSGARYEAAYWLAARIDLNGEPRDLILELLVQKMDGVWMVKVVDETMGPADLNVPAAILAAAPVDPQLGYSSSWRGKLKVRGAGQLRLL